MVRIREIKSSTYEEYNDWLFQKSSTLLNEALDFKDGNCQEECLKPREVE